MLTSVKDLIKYLFFTSLQVSFPQNYESLPVLIRVFSIRNSSNQMVIWGIISTSIWRDYNNKNFKTSVCPGERSWTLTWLKIFRGSKDSGSTTLNRLGLFTNLCIFFNSNLDLLTSNQLINSIVYDYFVSIFYSRLSSSQFRFKNLLDHFIDLKWGNNNSIYRYLGFEIIVVKRHKVYRTKIEKFREIPEEWVCEDEGGMNKGEQMGKMVERRTIYNIYVNKMLDDI